MGDREAPAGRKISSHADFVSPDLPSSSEGFPHLQSVTNDLYSGNSNVHTGTVHAEFLQMSSDKRPAAQLCRSSDAANSLFLKILPLTHLDPRFCQIKPIPGQRNPNESKTLPIRKKKTARPLVPGFPPRPRRPSVVYL